MKRFANAMTRAGLEPTLKFNGVEMINALAKRYEDDVDGTLAAAELGLTKDEWTEAVADSDKQLKPMLRRLEQGLVPRDQFETAFKALAKDITDDSPLEVAAVRRFLVEKFGLAPENLIPIGYGKSQLKDPADPFGGENRRVQIVNTEIK